MSPEPEIKLKSHKLSVQTIFNEIKTIYRRERVGVRVTTRPIKKRGYCIRDQVPLSKVPYKGSHRVPQQRVGGVDGAKTLSKWGLRRCTPTMNTFLRYTVHTANLVWIHCGAVESSRKDILTGASPSFPSSQHRRWGKES